MRHSRAQRLNVLFELCMLGLDLRPPGCHQRFIPRLEPCATRPGTQKGRGGFSIELHDVSPGNDLRHRRETHGDSQGEEGKKSHYYSQ
jgi:hypothetical protein